MRLPIDQINVGGRCREELGDLSYLKDSIASVGLLHPVVVTKAGSLVAGERRLAAVRELGWTDVPVTVVDNLKDAATLLRAEVDENTARKPFTPYEASRFRERQAELLKPLAEQREKAGKPCSNLDQGQTGRTRKLAAAGTGYSGSTLDKVDKIRDYTRMLDLIESTGESTVRGALKRVGKTLDEFLTESA